MLIQNAVKVLPDGPYIRSAHRHDYVEFTTADGCTHFLDGGEDYQRTDFNFWDSPLVENYTLTDESPFEEVCENMLWGTRGVDGTEPLQWVPVREMSLEHVQAVLKMNVGQSLRKVLEYWRRQKYAQLGTELEAA